MNRLRSGTNVVISIIGSFAILLMVNYLAMRHYTRSDWTTSQIYTLSDKSIKALSTLDREVKLVALWSKQSPEFSSVRELLERYSAVSNHVSLEIVDPDLNPDRVGLLVNKYGAKKKDVGGGMIAIDESVIVVSGDNIKFVTASEIYASPSSYYDLEPQEQMSNYNAEQALTSAIMRVTASSLPTVCFTQGHGEWVFGGVGGRGLTHVKEELSQNGYATTEIATIGLSRIPELCQLLVVAGPEKAFLDTESVLIENYLARGGRALLLLDPIVDGNRFAPTGLESIMHNLGIGLSSDFVIEIDPRRLVNQSPLTFLASEFTSHQSVSQFALPDQMDDLVREQIGAPPVVFAGARSLVINEDSEAISYVLARTSQMSWGESDLESLSNSEEGPTKDQYDISGPNILAMAISLATETPDAIPGRAVVVGDSDFLSEELFVSASLYNRDFFSGLVGWLTEREDLISIAPKDPEHVQLQLTDADVRSIWLTIGCEILLFALLGVYIRIKRRSR